MESKSLSNTNMSDATSTTPDIKTYGDPGAWVLICKASSESQGWMKSTKAMEVPGGCLLQVTSEFRDEAGRVTSCAEAIAFVPDVMIKFDRGLPYIDFY